MSPPAALFILAAATSAASPPAGEPDIVYLTRRGDTLYSLGNRYLLNPADYRRVQRVNHVADPRHLPTGMILRIPRPLLRTVPVEGRVIAFRGHVLLRNGGSSQTVTLGIRVGEGVTLTTDARSYVTVELPDTSRFSLPSQSQVGILRLRRILLNGEIERRFEANTGKSDWQVKPSSNDPFSVRTPIATTAVRGTQFRVTYDQALQSMTVGVIEGKVGVTGEATDGALAAGSGAALQPGEVMKPKALLSAPELNRPGALQTGSQLQFSATTVPGATAYGFELATDAGFVDRFSAIRTASPEGKFEGLPSGIYFVRVTAFDADGLEGMANTYSFERQLNRIEADTPIVHRTGRHRDYLFRWYGVGDGKALYRFILSRSEDGTDPLIDEIGLAATQISVRDLPRGIYYWRVWSSRFLDGRHSEVATAPQKLQIGETR